MPSLYTQEPAEEKPFFDNSFLESESDGGSPLLKQKSEGALGSRKATREKTTRLKGRKQARALCTVPHEVYVSTLGDFLAMLLNSIFLGDFLHGRLNSLLHL